MSAEGLRRHPWAVRALTGAVTALVVVGVALTIVGPRTASHGAGAGLRVQRRADRPDRFETRFEVMGTQGRFDVVAPSARTAERMFSAALARVRDMEGLMSTYRPESEISVLNRDGADRPVTLSADTMKVLRASLAISELTGGAFDVTYAPLRTLWRQAVRDGVPPAEADVDKALAAVGWKKFNLGNSTARFNVRGMAVDLGGIAKGYAIDRATEVLQEAGAKAGLVDLGGDLRLFGPGPADGKWHVMVRRPPGVDEEYILAVGACSVTTSGDYERWFRIGEHRFSHIIDPRTGRPVARVPSATVVAPDATMADGLATAISVMGAEEGVRFVDALDDVECLILERREDAGIRLHMSSGFDRLLME